MNNIAERKLKFLEMLLTLGSLLAIFLGFVVEKTGALLNDLVGLGVLFIVSALVSYTAALFPEIVRGRWVRLGVMAVSSLMAVSLAGLVSLGTAYFLGLSISGNTLDLGQSAIAAVVFIGSLVGVSELIRVVMRMEDGHPN